MIHLTSEFIQSVRELPEASRIRMLRLLREVPSHHRLEYLRWRAAGRRRIAECAEMRQLQTYDEDGEFSYSTPQLCVAVVESGRDCDGSAYSGHVRLIPARLEAYIELEDSIGKYADGPFSLVIVRPSEADSIEPESRDLALEAFEDGHSHVLSYVRFDDDR